MNVFQRFRRRKSPYKAASEEEQISRYVYLLNTLPASVIESAHATAFRKVPSEKRREMFESLRPFMAESERDAASDDPIVLARLLRRAEERKKERNAGSKPTDAATAVATAEGERGLPDPRDAAPDPWDVMSRAGVTHLVAYQFMTSATVSTYFLYGAGSVTIGDQPAWVGDMVEPGTTGYGSGGDYSSYGGGGFDGGFGGGFDGGGGGGGDG